MAALHTLHAFTPAGDNPLCQICNCTLGKEWHTQAVEASRDFMRAADRLPVLWELVEEFHPLVSLFETPADEQDTAAIEAELQRVVGDIRQKAHGVAIVLKRLEALAAFENAQADWLQKTEVDRLRAKAKATQANADRLRNYVLQCMTALGVDRIETGMYTLSVRLNNPAVQIVDASAIPEEFNRTTIVTEPNKTAIIAHYKETGEIVGGVEITRRPRLEVR